MLYELQNQEMGEQPIWLIALNDPSGPSEEDLISLYRLGEDD